MHNYYDLKKQMELWQTYLDRLAEQKEMVNSSLTPKTVDFRLIPGGGGGGIDVFTRYVVNITDIENEIATVKAEIDNIKRTLDTMDKLLREIKDTKYKIFVYRYLDGLSANEIAYKMNFSVRRIYQILNEIDEDLEHKKIAQNCTKTML